MSISPEDILSLSEALALTKECETTLRASVGRAYYAAYHHALSFHNSLAEQGVAPERATGMHASLIHQLKTPTEKDPGLRTKSKQIAYMLDTMRLARVNADYELALTTTENDAKSQIELAKRLLGLKHPFMAS